MTASLRHPLRREAPAPVDDVAAQRLWRGVQARRARLRRSVTRGTFLWLAAVGALLGTLLTVAVELSLRNPFRPEAPVSGPLTLRNGKPWGVTTAPPAAPDTAALADGSSIVLDPGARLEPLENTGRAISLLFVKGRATFDVHPGGPRRWSFECGLATVEVVGTRLSIDRTSERLVVQVEHGVVLVRGERVPDRVQRLRAGDRLEVHADVATAPSAVPVGQVDTSPGVTGSATERDIASSRAAPGRARAPWRELSTRGDYVGAYRALGPSGLGVASTASEHVDELMALADVARLSGHASDAVAPLGRVVREFGRDPRASLAAFTLGKIHMSEGGGGRLAGRDFTDALRLGLPSSLTEDAYANAVEAFRRAGDTAQACSMAAEYLARFPASPRAASLAAWASSR